MATITDVHPPRERRLENFVRELATDRRFERVPVSAIREAAEEIQKQRDLLSNPHLTEEGRANIMKSIHEVTKSAMDRLDAINRYNQIANELNTTGNVALFAARRLRGEMPSAFGEDADPSWIINLLLSRKE